MAKTSLDIARENVLVEAAAKLLPVLELECEGKRAVLLGGHQDDIDSINVRADGKVILLSEWVLERCLGLSEGTQLTPAEERRLTFTKAYVVSYANQHLPRTPLLEWCQAMCAQNGVSRLAKGSRLLVFWWDMLHDQQMGKAHMRGRTWWPTAYMPKYPQYGVWFSAQVVRYDAKRATLHIVYDYNAPDEKELGKVILPLNYVHFGDTPPQANGRAQVLPPPWEPPPVVGPRGLARATSDPAPLPPGAQCAMGQQAVVSGPAGRMQSGAGAGDGKVVGGAREGLTTEEKKQQQPRLKQQQQLEQRDAVADSRPEGQQPQQGEEQWRGVRHEQPVEQQQNQKAQAKEGAGPADAGAKEKGEKLKLPAHWEQGPGQEAPLQQQGRQRDQQGQRQPPSAGAPQAKVVVRKGAKPEEVAAGLEAVKPAKKKKKPEASSPSLPLQQQEQECKVVSATGIKRKAEEQQGQQQAEQGPEGGLAAEGPPRAKRAKAAARGGPSPSPAVLDGVVATGPTTAAATEAAPAAEDKAMAKVEKAAKGRMVAKRGTTPGGGGAGDTTAASVAAGKRSHGRLAHGNGGGSGGGGGATAAADEAMLMRSRPAIGGDATAGTAAAVLSGGGSLEGDQCGGDGGVDLGIFEDGGGGGVDLGTSLETTLGAIDMDATLDMGLGAGAPSPLPMQLEKPQLPGRRVEQQQQQQQQLDPLSFPGSGSGRPVGGDAAAPQSEGRQKQPGTAGTLHLPPKPPRPPLQQQLPATAAKDAVPHQGSSSSAARFSGVAAIPTMTAVNKAAAGSGNKAGGGQQPNPHGSCSPRPTPIAKLPAKTPVAVVASAAPAAVGAAAGKPASSPSSAAVLRGVAPGSEGGGAGAAERRATVPGAVVGGNELFALEAGDMERPGGEPGTRAEGTKVRALISLGCSTSAGTSSANSVQQPPLQQLVADSQPQAQAQARSQSQPPAHQPPALQPASGAPKAAHRRSSPSSAQPKAGAIQGEDKGAGGGAEGSKRRSSDGAGPSQVGSAPPTGTVAAQNPTGVKWQCSDSGRLGDRGASREGVARTPTVLEVVEVAAGASGDGAALGAGALSPSPWPVVNLALGPTSRVRWPGLNLMMPSQIAELVRMPAVIPLARPSCDAHVAALEGRVEAVEAVLDGGAPLHLRLPPPMDDSDDDDHTLHFLQQGRQGLAGPPAGPTLGASLVSLRDSMWDLADVVDAVAPLGQCQPALPHTAATALPEAEATDFTVTAAPLPPPVGAAAAAAQAGALGCSTEELPQGVAAARAPGTATITAATSGQQQQQQQPEQQQVQSLLRGSSGGGLLEDDEEDEDDAFSFVDRGKYRIVLPPLERLAAYEEIGRERTTPNKAAVATAGGMAMVAPQAV